MQFELKKIGQKYTAPMTKFFTKKKHNFSRKKVKKTEVPKMTSKVVYELLLRSYGQFKFFRNFWTKNTMLWSSFFLHDNNVYFAVN